VSSSRLKPQTRGFRFPLDLLVRTPAELRRRLALGDFFLREIMDSGVALYEGAHA
jgi:hypothetical protein